MFTAAFELGPKLPGGFDFKEQLPDIARRAPQPNKSMQYSRHKCREPELMYVYIL